LQRHVSKEMEKLHVSGKIKKYKRPKIAIIDTGFDNRSFKDRKLKSRLNMLHTSNSRVYNWKDYCRSESEPHDNSGHGTAMLSIIHRVAPFADICVARIANEDDDLRNDPVKTSQNLAQVLEKQAMTMHQSANAVISGYPMGYRETTCRYCVYIARLETGADRRQRSCY
jgi:hypothetical protein